MSRKDRFTKREEPATEAVEPVVEVEMTDEELANEPFGTEWKGMAHFNRKLKAKEAAAKAEQEQIMADREYLTARQAGGKSWGQREFDNSQSKPNFWTQASNNQEAAMNVAMQWAAVGVMGSMISLTWMIWLTWFIGFGYTVHRIRASFFIEERQIYIVTLMLWIIAGIVGIIYFTQ